MARHAISPLGILLRKIRRDRKELLGDMARKINISTSELSAIEHGKTSIPYDLPDRIRLSYNISTQNIEVIKKAIFESELGGNDYPPFDTRLIAAFSEAKR